jgi:hypothetical protein
MRDGVDGRRGSWETAFMRVYGEIAWKPDTGSDGQTEHKLIGARPGSGDVNPGRKAECKKDRKETVRTVLSSMCIHEMESVTGVGR